MRLFGKKKTNQVPINVFPQNITIFCGEGETLLEALLQKKLPVSHSCEGMGTCGTCRVQLYGKNPKVDKSNMDEGVDRKLAEDEILACQAYPTEELNILIGED